MNWLPWPLLELGGSIGRGSLGIPEPAHGTHVGWTDQTAVLAPIVLRITMGGALAAGLHWLHGLVVSLVGRIPRCIRG